MTLCGCAAARAVFFMSLPIKCSAMADMYAAQCLMTSFMSSTSFPMPRKIFCGWWAPSMPKAMWGIAIGKSKTCWKRDVRFYSAGAPARSRDCAHFLKKSIQIWFLWSWSAMGFPATICCKRILVCRKGNMAQGLQEWSFVTRRRVGIIALWEWSLQMEKSIRNPWRLIHICKAIFGAWP